MSTGFASVLERWFGIKPAVPKAPPTPQSRWKVRPTLLPPDQAAVVAHARSGLQMLAEKSKRAHELLIFFNLNGVEAEWLPGGGRCITKATGDLNFFVVGDPKKHEDLNGRKAMEAASFAGYPYPIMRLQGTQMCLLDAGVMLAH